MPAKTSDYHSLLLNMVMNSHGPGNLLKNCTAWIRAACTEKSVYAPWPRLCKHIHVTQRCTILMLQLPSTFTANTTGMPHPAGMTCLGFQRPPLLKWKNTSRILKHTSQNKGSKVGAEVLHTMKPRAAMSSSVYKRDGNKHQLPKTHNLM